MVPGSLVPPARPLRIAISGLGYVGTTSAACLLRQGHRILGCDISQAKLELVGRGRSPVVEPEVEALLAAGHRDGRLEAGCDLRPRIDEIDMVLVCVGTPSRADGKLELTQLLELTRQLGRLVRRRRRDLAPLLLVYRSTVPPGTMEQLVLPTLQSASGEEPGRCYEVAFNPEFLREATAVKDYFAPPKIVIGERRQGVTGRLMGLYDGIDAPLFEVPLAIAETAKLVDNSFHALKVAFANEIGRLCQALRVEPQQAMDLFLADTKLNISPVYLRPGGAYGGSCLPKDLGAVLALGREGGVALPVLEGVRQSNERHLDFMVELVRRRLPPPGPILQLGLSFKANTDDLRNSPLVDLAERLVQAGYELMIHDPDVQPERLTGVNFAIGAEHRGTVLERITPDPEAAAARARLVLLGKPMPAAQRLLPPDLDLLDLNRLTLAAG